MKSVLYVWNFVMIRIWIPNTNAYIYYIYLYLWRIERNYFFYIILILIHWKTLNPNNPFQCKFANKDWNLFFLWSALVTESHFERWPCSSRSLDTFSIHCFTFQQNRRCFFPHFENWIWLFFLHIWEYHYCKIQVGSHAREDQFWIYA